MTHVEPSRTAAPGADRRRYPRFDAPIRVALKGDDGNWHWHGLQDLSAVGVALAPGAELAVGTQVQVQIERVGGGIGRVVRSADGAPCLDLERGDAPPDLRHRRVAWLASDTPDYRRHQRIRPAPPTGKAIAVPVRLGDGTHLDVPIDDVSASGMRLARRPGALAELPLGTQLVAGGVGASIVWANDDAVALAFDRPIDVKRLTLKARSVTL